MNAKITLSHSDFHRYKIKGFSEALYFLNERAVGSTAILKRCCLLFLRVSVKMRNFADIK